MYMYIYDDCRRLAVLNLVYEQFRLWSNLRLCELPSCLIQELYAAVKSATFFHDEIFYSIISFTWSIITL